LVNVTQVGSAANSVSPRSAKNAPTLLFMMIMSSLTAFRAG
jgi:hypothetical protein